MEGGIIDDQPLSRLQESIKQVSIQVLKTVRCSLLVRGHQPIALFAIIDTSLWRRPDLSAALLLTQMIPSVVCNRLGRPFASSA